MLQPLTASGRESIVPTAAGLLTVAAATALAYWLRLNLASTVLLQLLVVVVAALRIGFWQATFVSVFANACLTYFIIPPVFSFTISDPQNWVALGAFEFTALVVSRLSTSAQMEAANSASRQLEIERLYEFSSKLLLLDRKEAPGPAITRLVSAIFRAEAVALFDCSSGVMSAAGECDEEMENLVRDLGRGRRVDNWDAPTFLRALQGEGQAMATLALRGPSITRLTFDSIASLTLVTLERRRSLENESKAEGERQTERLRAAVLDALAHEIKTPLTTIRTASTAILAMRSSDFREKRLVSLIDAEAIKLDRLTTRLLQTSRLDSADVRLQLELADATEIIRDTLGSLSEQLGGHSVRTHGLDQAVELYLDRQLVITALTQIVDNAAKYSNPGTPINIYLENRETETRILVHNVGPMIPRDQMQRIFERFYRGAGFQSRPGGTGLGLSVTKKIIEAHGGTVGVQSGIDGNTFCISLPNAQINERSRLMELRARAR